MRRLPVTFLCDANTSVGFGHLSRCLKLAFSLRRSRAIRFGGRFSAEARRRISQYGFSVEEPPARYSGGLAVVDIMFDKEDMDYYDLRRLGRIRKQFQRVVVLSSAMTVPDDLPADAVIGHVLQGGRAARSPLRVFAGLDYSPVSTEFQSSRARRAEVRNDIGRIFVGFGASRDIMAWRASWTPSPCGASREKWMCCCRRFIGGSKRRSAGERHRMACASIPTCARWPP